jgi:hypothetical protein
MKVQYRSLTVSFQQLVKVDMGLLLLMDRTVHSTFISVETDPLSRYLATYKYYSAGVDQCPNLPELLEMIHLTQPLLYRLRLRLDGRRRLDFSMVLTITRRPNVLLTPSLAFWFLLH